MLQLSPSSTVPDDADSFAEERDFLSQAVTAATNRRQSNAALSHDEKTRNWERSGDLRREGNHMFQMNRHKDALQLYWEALEVLPDPGGPVSPDFDADGSMHEDVGGAVSTGALLRDRVSVFSNMAECYIQLGLWSNAINCCTSALLSDARHEKSLLRRQRAVIGLGLKLGLTWATGAAKIQPPVSTVSAKQQRQESKPLLACGDDDEEDDGAGDEDMLTDDDGGVVEAKTDDSTHDTPIMIPTPTPQCFFLFDSPEFKDNEPLRRNPAHMWLMCLLYDCAAMLPQGASDSSEQLEEEFSEEPDGEACPLNRCRVRCYDFTLYATHPCTELTPTQQLVQQLLVHCKTQIAELPHAIYSNLSRYRAMGVELLHLTKPDEFSFRHVL